jgi:uncharacterized nucleotidyltransferase DUF6036
VTRRELPLDARAILHVLAEQEVDFVVIGGLAVQAHGHPRTTQDLDLVPDPDASNLGRLRAALAVLGARPVGARKPATAPISIPAAGVLELDTDAGGIDVHTHAPGAAPYPELRQRALELELGDVHVLVAGRDDLIAMKRASGRPIDRGDILALTEPDA